MLQNCEEEKRLYESNTDIALFEIRDWIHHNNLINRITSPIFYIQVDIYYMLFVSLVYILLYICTFLAYVTYSI